MPIIRTDQQIVLAGITKNIRKVIIGLTRDINPILTQQIFAEKLAEPQRPILLPALRGSK